MDLKSKIRDIPDFPKKGILFKDITTLLKDGPALKKTVDLLYEKAKEFQPDLIVGMESRGFIFAPLIAYLLGVGFVPTRKPGKLPAETIAQEYVLEYGSDKIEIHKDAILPGQRVLIVDDLLATGGTAAAVGELVKQLGGEIAGYLFLIELDFLKGREKLSGKQVVSLLSY